jgi:hypothetical protein
MKTILIGLETWNVHANGQERNSEKRLQYGHVHVSKLSFTS